MVSMRTMLVAVSVVSGATARTTRNMSGSVTNCPFEEDSKPLAKQSVVQYIKGQLHSWEEHQVGDEGDFCIFQTLPQRKMLSSIEAKQLLADSSGWKKSFDKLLIHDPPAKNKWKELIKPMLKEHRNGSMPQEKVDHMFVPDSNLQTFSEAFQAPFTANAVDTLTYPWHSVGLVLAEYDENNAQLFSGVLLSPYVLLSSAWWFFSDTGDAAQIISPAPGAYMSGDELEFPFGAPGACRALISSYFVPNDLSLENVVWDYGLYPFYHESVSENLKQLTYMPVQFDNDLQAGQTATLAGYEDLTMYDVSGTISQLTQAEEANFGGFIIYTSMTGSAQSDGGPILQASNGEYRIVGLKAGVVELSSDSDGQESTTVLGVGPRFSTLDEEFFTRVLQDSAQNVLC